MKVSQTDSRPVQGNEASSTTKAERVAKANAAKKNGKTEGTGAVAGDAKSEISSRGKEMAQAREVASSAPDVREAKIAELKRRIEAGKYNVDNDAVADKLVNEHLMQGMG